MQHVGGGGVVLAENVYYKLNICWKGNTNYKKECNFEAILGKIIIKGSILVTRGSENINFPKYGSMKHDEGKGTPVILWTPWFNLGRAFSTPTIDYCISYYILEGSFGNAKEFFKKQSKVQEAIPEMKETTTFYLKSKIVWIEPANPNKFSSFCWDNGFIISNSWIQ